MRISDWISDVCSSDLGDVQGAAAGNRNVLGRHVRAILDRIVGQPEARGGQRLRRLRPVGDQPGIDPPQPIEPLIDRQEERRGGYEGVRWCRYLWSTCPYKNN